jgi:protein O-mannosyl-transferase
MDNKSIIFLQKNYILPYVIIGVVTILLYVQIVPFGFSYLDDKMIILDNYHFIGSISNTFKAFTTGSFIGIQGDTYFRPIQTITFMFDAFFSGKNPWMYHITNILLHSISSFLVYHLLIVFFPNSKFNLFLTLLFCVHPLFTNAVAWIPSRGDLLIGCLGIFSFLNFYWYIDKKRWYNVVIHLIAFLVALFSKETAIVMPLLCIYYYFVVNKKRIAATPIILLILFWTFSITFYWFFRNHAVHDTFTHQMFGINSFVSNFPVIFIVFGKFFFPFNISVLPSIDLLSTLIGIIVIGVMVKIVLSTKKMRLRIAFFGMFWYLLFIIPSLFVQHYLGENSFGFLYCRMYLPTVGIMIFLSELLSTRTALFQNKWVSTCAVVILLSFSLVTVINSRDYKDPITFSTSALTHNPQSVVAYNTRGLANLDQGYISAAIQDFNNAVMLRPDFPETFYNRGNVYLKSQNYEAALNDYDKAILLGWNFVSAYYNRAIVKWHLHDYPGSINDCNKTIELSPAYSEAYFQRALVQTDLGNIPKALSDYDSAIIYSTTKVASYPIALYNNRSDARRRIGDYKGAIDDCNKALEIDATNAQVYYNRAVAKYGMHDLPEAMDDFTLAINYDQNYGSAYFNRGVLRLQLNDRAGACEDFKKSFSLGLSYAKDLIDKNCTGSAENR